MSLLEGEIAALVGEAFGDAGLFSDAVLARDGASTGPDYNPTPGAPTEHTCKVVVDTYSDYHRANNLVDGKDRKLLVLATSIDTVPAPSDRITVHGSTFTLINVKTDPASAVWECQGRV